MHYAQPGLFYPARSEDPLFRSLHEALNGKIALARIKVHEKNPGIFIEFRQKPGNRSKYSTRGNADAPHP